MTKEEKKLLKAQKKATQNIQDCLMEDVNLINNMFDKLDTADVINSITYLRIYVKLFNETINKLLNVLK